MKLQCFFFAFEQCASIRFQHLPEQKDTCCCYISFFPSCPFWAKFSYYFFFIIFIFIYCLCRLSCVVWLLQFGVPFVVCWWWYWMAYIIIVIFLWLHIFRIYNIYIGICVCIEAKITNLDRWYIIVLVMWRDDKDRFTQFFDYYMLCIIVSAGLYLFVSRVVFEIVLFVYFLFSIFYKHTFFLLWFL